MLLDPVNTSDGYLAMLLDPVIVVYFCWSVVFLRAALVQGAVNLSNVDRRRVIVIGLEIKTLLCAPSVLYKEERLFIVGAQQFISLYSCSSAS